MKKVFGLVTLLLIASTAVCLANPIPDYSLGDITLGLSLGAPSVSTGSEKSSSKLSVGGDLTVGVGLGLAGQYTYDDIKLKSSLHGSSEVKAQQLRVVDNLFNVVANVSVFAGLTKSQAVGGSEHNGVSVGIASSLPVAPKTKAYGILETGSRISGYELGLSYEMTSNTDFNLGYRDTTYKGLNFQDTTTGDVSAKGLVGGVSIKF